MRPLLLASGRQRPNEYRGTRGLLVLLFGDELLEHYETARQFREKAADTRRALRAARFKKTEQDDAEPDIDDPQRAPEPRHTPTSSGGAAADATAAIGPAAL